MCISIFFFSHFQLWIPVERPRAPAPFTTSITQRTRRRRRRKRGTTRRRSSRGHPPRRGRWRRRRRRRRKKVILVLKVSTIYVLGVQIFLYPFNLVAENLVIYNHSYRLGAEYLGDPDLDPVWIRIHFFIVYHFILNLCNKKRLQILWMPTGILLAWRRFVLSERSCYVYIVYPMIFYL